MSKYLECPAYPGQTYDWSYGFCSCGQNHRSAGMGVGHVWTNVQCPAYRSFVAADCKCGE